MATNHAHRDVYLLAICQALLATGNALVVSTSALVGQTLAPDGLATLPLFLQFVAIMSATLPASLLMRQIGRRAGFSIGAGFALSAGLLGSGAILIGSFVLFCVASLAYGVFMAFGLYYRFAAADASTPSFRPRAISYVLAGGVVAAIAGPELARATDDLFGPALFAGSYAAIAGLGGLTLLTLMFLRMPLPSNEERSGNSRPTLRIMRQPDFVIALAAAAIAQGAMVLVMTATPLAMAFCGHGFDQTAFVIQWHILGMFAPSFFTGHLISRFGVLNVMALGALLILTCLGVALSGIEVAQFWVALLLLGVGWNFLYVGGTTMLTYTYSMEERFRAQAVNEFLVFGTAATASLLAGTVMHYFGWVRLMLIPIPILILVCLALLLVRRDSVLHRTRYT